MNKSTNNLFKNRYFFRKKAPSWMSDWILNTPLLLHLAFLYLCFLFFILFYFLCYFYCYIYSKMDLCMLHILQFSNAESFFIELHDYDLRCRGVVIFITTKFHLTESDCHRHQCHRHHHHYICTNARRSTSEKIIYNVQCAKPFCFLQTTKTNPKSCGFLLSWKILATI